MLQLGAESGVTIHTVGVLGELQDSEEKTKVTKGTRQSGMVQIRVGRKHLSKQSHSISTRCRVFIIVKKIIALDLG